MALNPFFRYFGSKWRCSAIYPKPVHETIVEPFAGSAGYATRYHHKRVVLVEKDPEVAALWRYLIRVTPRELLALPDLPPEGVSALKGVCDDAVRLIRYNVNRTSGNHETFTRWSLESPDRVWGRTFRGRLASQVSKIRHWQIIEGDYSLAPDVEATWFVDPPYEELGLLYSQSAAAIDFTALAEWCKARRGQVVVCEQEGAEWLPFRMFAEVDGSRRGTGHDGISREAIWTND